MNSKHRIITPDWSAPSNVVAFSTTRQAGVSTAPYDSFNLADHVGDLPESVAKNRAELNALMALPQEPVWLQQVHSAEIAVLANVANEFGANPPTIADGSFSSHRGRVCVVMTADCMPLLLCDRAGTQIAAVHAGWRGMANGIIEQAVKLFSCAPANLIAWAGPTIGQNNFEVGLEVKGALGGSDEYYHPGAEGKCFADLYRLAGERLKEIGVVDYSHADVCTYADDERFFSYRRDGECGRQATAIYLD